MKIIFVVGARPNFIKLAPLIKEIKKEPKFDVLIVHTGQHYDLNMSALFFKDLNIPKPDYNLGVGSYTHALQTAKIMIKFEEVCLKEKPDLVIVVGDVNSTLATALVAAKLGIKVAHIEAGLRSFDKSMPEEINRILTDHISDILFCPSTTSVENLKKEGITKGIHLVGDIMYDAVLHFLKIAENKIQTKYKDHYLVTIHRPCNADNKQNLSNIFKAFSKLNKSVIIPLHPRTRKMLQKFNIKIANNIKIIEPVGYLEMIILEKNADLILTDSGGIQKEAYYLKTPCITIRNSTEWVETLGNGNMLVKADVEKIIEAVNLMNKRDFKFNEDFYGDGNTAEKIIKIIKDDLKNKIFN